MNYKARWEKVINNMKAFGLDEIILSSGADIFYLTGIWLNTGERMTVIHLDTGNRKTLVTNRLFGGMTRNIGIDVEFFDDGQDPIGLLKKHIGFKKSLGIDKNWPSHFLLELMAQRGDLCYKNGSPVLEEAKLFKDTEETARMRDASRTADHVMGELIASIDEITSEKQLAESARRLFAKHGTNRLAFEPTVSFGANSGNPTHEAGDFYCKKGDSVLIDIGGVTSDYCSDITRTVFFGRPDKEAMEVYQIVLEANLKAISTVKPGVRFSDIDRAARDIIEKHGYGRFFTHRTGHCIGIQDHEAPFVSHDNNRIVEPGMTFSIEPGVYLNGKFGIRIEDLVAVTQYGAEVLNKSPKDMQIIGG